MTISQQYQRDWQRYFDCTADKPPRDTLLRALAAFGDLSGRTALDIACGVGRDSIEMLRRGMSVTATDIHPDALHRLRVAAGPDSAHRLITVECPMEDIATTPSFEEDEKDGDDAMGGTKHHHVYHIVAMKPVRSEKETVT